MRPANDRRIEAEHHDGNAAVGRPGIESLLRIKDTAVRWIETRLVRLRVRRAPLQRTFQTGSMPRPGTSGAAAVAFRRAKLFRAYPRSRSAFGSRAWSGTGAGQTAGFQHTTWRDYVRASTKSSMWGVKAREMAAPDLVAIQPPSVEYSKLCGKCRSVTPCGLSWSSSDGP